MKIYFAARFSRRHEVHALGKILEEHGHKVVSRWSLPDSDHIKPTGLSRQASDDERRRFAQEDLQDIDNCNWVICFMDQPRNDGRGGKHVEFGYAMAKGKLLTIIGPRETVFHHLTFVSHYDTVADFLAGVDLSIRRLP